MKSIWERKEVPFHLLNTHCSFHYTDFLIELQKGFSQIPPLGLPATCHSDVVLSDHMKGCHQIIMRQSNTYRNNGFLQVVLQSCCLHLQIWHQCALPRRLPGSPWRTTCFSEVPPSLSLRDAHSQGPGVPDEDPVTAFPRLWCPFGIRPSLDAPQGEVNGLNRFPCCTKEEAE